MFRRFPDKAMRRFFGILHGVCLTVAPKTFVFEMTGLAGYTRCENDQ
jgi:hypothetical protein